MKKNTCYSLTAILLISFFIFSCKEKKNENIKPGQVEFAFSAKALKSSLKSENSDTITGLTWVVYTIEDASGNVIKNSEKIELYNMNGDYISKPISLVKGSYKLTRFMLLSWDNKILYASPVKGSPKAYLVQTPLPILFNVQNDEVTKLSPEVLSSIGCSPEDFGYATFGFEVANTFDFLIGVFVYNDLVKNYELTSATITITSGTASIIPGVQLNAKQNDPLGLVSAYDSIGVTNKITLPSNYNNYTLVISKVGYKTFSQTYTKEDLKQHLRSVDKGPLVVALDADLLSDCEFIVLKDDFASSTNWQSEGNGDVNISNGKCNYSNVYDYYPNRVYKSLGTALSNDYWNAKCEFSLLNANTSGHGTSIHIMALTEGILDYESTQNGIEVFITSASSTDNNINNWYFGIGYHKGSTLVASTSPIYASSVISDYYIKLERTSVGTTQLSVFADSKYTTPLPGSPITFSVDPTISGLNTLQHATCTAGSPSRLINATVDNDLICQNSK
jgi:hypothetical protein